MGDLRVRYGFAKGRQNNFLAGIAGQKGYLAGTDGLFGQGDTTPDVTNGCLFYSNNSGLTTITDFDLSSPRGGGQPGLYEGKEITIMFLDTNTRLAKNSRLVTAGSTGVPQAANTIVELFYHNSAWFEKNRSITANDYVQTTSALLGTTGAVTVLGGVKVVEIFSAAGSASILRTALGGEQGQRLTLIAVGGSDSTVICNSAANFTFVVTSSAGSPTQFRMMNSGSTTFIYRGNQWLEERPVAANSSGFYN